MASGFIYSLHTIIHYRLQNRARNSFILTRREWSHAAPVHQAEILFRVSAILICRFIIDLRNIYVSDVSDEFDTPSNGQAATIRFAHSIVGNAGAPLETFLDDGDSENDPMRYARDPFEYGLLRRDSTASPTPAVLVT